MLLLGACLPLSWQDAAVRAKQRVLLAGWRSSAGRNFWDACRPMLTSHLYSFHCGGFERDAYGQNRSNLGVFSDAGRRGRRAGDADAGTGIPPTRTRGGRCGRQGARGNCCARGAAAGTPDRTRIITSHIQRAGSRDDISGESGRWRLLSTLHTANAVAVIAGLNGVEGRRELRSDRRITCPGGSRKVATLATHLLQWLIRWSYRRADAVVAVSTGVADDLVDTPRASALADPRRPESNRYS